MIDGDFTCSINENGMMSVENDDLRVDNLKCSLAGEHQAYNAACAIQAAYIYMLNKEMKLTGRVVKKSIEKVKWPGRFQIISRKPEIITDCAHNIDGMRALEKTLKHYYPDRKIVFLLGVLKDKRFREMCKQIACMGAMYILSPLKHKRSLYPETLRKIFDGILPDTGYAASIADGIELYTRELKSPRSILCIAGSSFSVSEAMQYINSRSLPVDAIQ